MSMRYVRLNLHLARLYTLSMVQERKETHDHVSVRVKCLNYTCPNEFSVVGINKAILISSMILRVETTLKSSSIGGRFMYWNDLYHLSPQDCDGIA